VQQRLDANPQAMRKRRETVEHPFGTMKARMGATHFLTKTLPKVAAEMALSVLAYNLASHRLPGKGVFTRPRPRPGIVRGGLRTIASSRCALVAAGWQPTPAAVR